MQSTILTVVTVTVWLLASGCGKASPTSPTAQTAPTAPTAPTVALSLGSLRVTPEGVGVLHDTDFLFEATGTFPGGTQFTWQFGDGSSATTSVPTATRTYARTGSFAVIVEARAGSASTAASRTVSVGSLVGRWVGLVTGHTRFPPNRPIPIRSFDLTIRNAPAPGSYGYATLDATWADDAGCRQTRSIVQSFTPRPIAQVGLSIESLPCNDGDLSIAGAADANFTRVEGICANGGPNCRFQMVRQ